VLQRFAFVLSTSLAITVFGQTTSPMKTVLDAVYTPDQAAQGEMEFRSKCTKCHEGDDAEGPVLTGRTFIDRWREDDLDSLFEFIRNKMPADDAGSLSDGSYINIVAHLLEVNGYPAGKTSLSLETIPKIRVVGPDGPKPLPNNTLVQVLGCLTQTGNDWALTSASDPVRSREGTESTQRSRRFK